MFYLPEVLLKFSKFIPGYQDDVILSFLLFYFWRQQKLENKIKSENIISTQMWTNAKKRNSAATGPASTKTAISRVTATPVTLRPPTVGIALVGWNEFSRCVDL